MISDNSIETQRVKKKEVLSNGLSLGKLTKITRKRQQKFLGIIVRLDLDNLILAWSTEDKISRGLSASNVFNDFATMNVRTKNKRDSKSEKLK